MVSESQEAPLRVLVAGGGVAGLEALLALRDMAADRVELTLLSPDADFVYRPLAVAEPFSMGHVHRYSLRRFADDLSVRLVRGSLERVDADERLVTTVDGDPLGFEALLVATGAGAEPAVERALTWWPEGDPEAFGGLLRDIEEGYSKRIAFVVPPRVAWPLPAYELALMTARQVRSMGADGVELTLVTPEDGPLAIFGSQATQAVAEELDAAGVRVITGAYVEAAEPGHIELQPGARRLEVERVVALPRAVGPRVAGVPADDEGFIPIDEHARVIGFERVWAAGDGANFPIKQGGLAAQQADVVAEQIAWQLGAEHPPHPYRPVLRGLLRTADGPRYLRAEPPGEPTSADVSEECLWWPASKVAARWLTPWLAARDVERRPPPTVRKLPTGGISSARG
jgi:sulfide:quinone oxidoreductase